jgi:dephospho-CoA kinase
VYVLGVTGGIGSGKSTVAELFRKRGARVIDADAVVRELYSGGELPRAIAARFGAHVVDGSGAVDRPALGAVVFADPEKRRELERMVHPAVRREALARLEAWRGEGFRGIAVLDAALLVESDFEYPLDGLLVVTAPRSVRLDRLERRGTPREEAERRMGAQSDDQEKRARADFVVDNGGDLGHLEREVDRVLRELGRDDAGGSG